MRTLHLAIDCDDVIVNFWPRVIRCFNKEFGESIEEATQNDWGDNPIKKSGHFGPGRRYEDWWAWWRDRHWLWSACDAVDGAIGGLSDLAAQGHYIELVTHKPEWARREMTAWLAKWHPYFDRLTIVRLEDSKAEATGADVLVDDKPKNVRQWLEGWRPAILFTRPWNEHVQTDPTLPYGLFRADTWNDVLTLIGLLAHNTKEFPA